MKSAIIIGGPPSSGSSLLIDLLGRHSLVSSFSETHLLAKPSLWYDWNQSKQLIRNDSLKSPDWFMHKGIDNITKEQLSLIPLESSHSLIEYSSQLFAELTQQQENTIWCEKTPANIYYFHLYDNSSTIFNRILTVRNPYDTIASLIFRQVPIIDAVCRTLLNLGIGYLQLNKNKIHVIKYESLVRSPESILSTLLNKIQVSYEESIFDERTGRIKMEGWKNYEDGKITSDSIGRFKELPIDKLSQVIYLTNKLFINEAHLSANNIEQSGSEKISIPLLANHFKYSIPDVGELTINVKRHFFLDKLIRKIKGYPSHQPYPISI